MLEMQQPERKRRVGVLTRSNRVCENSIGPRRQAAATAYHQRTPPLASERPEGGLYFTRTVSPNVQLQLAGCWPDSQAPRLWWSEASSCGSTQDSWRLARRSGP